MRYRVSHLEAFRQWEADEDEEHGVEWIWTRLFGDAPPSPAMLAGTAFHKALELVPPVGIEFNSLTALGHTFNFAGDFEVELTAIRELRASKTYIVDGQPIVVSGQVDQIEGLRIDDHKTTAHFDADRFLSGYQWRLYLDIFGAQHFRWNVFELKRKGDDYIPSSYETTAAPVDGDDGLIYYTVTGAHRLEQFRYPGLERDCLDLVTRFARFVRSDIAVAA